jgi:YidC/Oxa1 family membrane protein insertase
MEEDKRNVVLFFAVSMMIMIGYPYFFNDTAVAPEPTVATRSVEGQSGDPATSSVPKVAVPIQQAKVENIRLESENLSGIICSRGAKIDNVSLKKYKKDLDGDEIVKVLDGENHFAQTGWTTDDPNAILPDENSRWQASSTRLSEDSPVTLTWDNGAGLLFEKHISIDKNFLITVVDKVKNYGADATSLKFVATASREFPPEGNSMNFYEGPLGYIDGKLEEMKYEDISKKGEIRRKSQGGWFGITDKYWLTAFVPDQKQNCDVAYKHSSVGAKSSCRVEISTDAILIVPSAEISQTHRLFVGAKEIKTLDAYEEKLGAKHFDLAIDFGWLYVITKPLLYALAYVKDLVGNMGLGIILITLIIKLLLFPLANRSYRSMNRMTAIQPKIQELRKKYEGDNVKLGQAVSELYKKENINPVGGCLPLLLQSPVLFALYKVLYVSIEMRQAPFMWWIRDLSAADPLTILNLFGLIPISLPGFLQIGIWPLLMGLTMLAQQKMSPAPADPAQANMMLIMPIMFTFMFAQLPSGLVIYWTFSNLLGIAQQWAIKRLDENSPVPSVKKS